MWINSAIHNLAVRLVRVVACLGILLAEIPHQAAYALSIVYLIHYLVIAHSASIIASSLLGTLYATSTRGEETHTKVVRVF